MAIYPNWDEVCVLEIPKYSTIQMGREGSAGFDNIGTINPYINIIAVSNMVYLGVPRYSAEEMVPPETFFKDHMMPLYKWLKGVQ